jgi:hypothetical protein
MKVRSSVMLEQVELRQAARLWFGCVLLSVVLFFVEQAGWSAGMRGGVEQVMGRLDELGRPLHQVVTEPQRLVRSWYQRSERLADLESRLMTATIDQAKLAYWESLETAGVLEGVVGLNRWPRLWAQLTHYQNRIYISAGENDGVAVGSGVSDANGYLIGRIGFVGKYVSEVEPVGVDGLVVPVKTNRGALGVVMASGDDVVISEVLATEPLAVGDVVITSGIDGLLPPDLVIGQVTELTGRLEDVTKGGVLEVSSLGSGWGGIW